MGRGSLSGAVPMPVGVVDRDGVQLSSTTIIEIEYDINNNPIYVCEADAGTATSSPNWRIYRLVYDANGNLLRKQYADGNTMFDNVCDDRATLSYA